MNAGPPSRTTDVYKLAMEDAMQALIYLDAAERVIGEEYEEFSTDLQYLAPDSFLIAHAVELGLNAFLRLKRKKGGMGDHDLLTRLSAAESAGLIVTDEFRRYVTIANDPHKKYKFRYASGTGFSFLSPRGVIVNIRPVLKNILEMFVVRPDWSNYAALLSLCHRSRR